MVGARWVESTDRKRSHREENYQKKRRQTSRSEVSAAEAAAATSLADVMADTREGLFARTLHSTNPIESMISICRDSTGNVERWRNGQRALRCCAAGILKAEKQFRRVNGHLHLAALRQALDLKTAGRHTSTIAA